jgi:repressor LexA
MHRHVQALVEANLVEPMHGKQRGVQLRIPQQREPIQLPLLGFIAAGHPIEATELPEHIGVPPHLLRDKPCYVLQIKGNSMIEDGILDGDWVVIEQRKEARNEEIVVALIDGYETTLKRIAQRPGEIVLYPANRDLQPMTLAPERVQIQGVIIGQLRSYR